ncbi:type II toxin-antitoxin system VapC family toxin [Sphingomonas montana]|uniref:type II toxin-antitoxin system VapC family toxin n=1 Tax=Sphingomonas montana TaxID=1843236 RepID=UPI00096D40F9|nr:type II toxin-antitoxin system VapC family toxin [Sphingomonas montana]
MTFVDTNILIDIFQDDLDWCLWSAGRLQAATEAGPVMIDAIIVAELSRNYPSLADLMAPIKALSLDIAPIDAETAHMAGRRFAAYRKQRPAGAPPRPLPDFFIGAHAITQSVPLLTRDASIYRTYFPELTLITPEDEHD